MAGHMLSAARRLIQSSQEPRETILEPHFTGEKRQRQESAGLFKVTWLVMGRDPTGTQAGCVRVLGALQTLGTAGYLYVSHGILSLSQSSPHLGPGPLPSFIPAKCLKHLLLQLPPPPLHLPGF